MYEDANSLGFAHTGMTSSELAAVGALASGDGRWPPGGPPGDPLGVFDGAATATSVTGALLQALADMQQQ